MYENHGIIFIYCTDTHFTKCLQLTPLYTMAAQRQRKGLNQQKRGNHKPRLYIFTKKHFKAQMKYNNKVMTLLTKPNKN